jgi:hypothetical protein
MTRTKTACGLATLLAAVLVAGPAAAIKCQDGNQLVQGNWLATPYCQDQNLGKVARELGFKASDAQIHNNPNYKKELCRSVFNDIRVQMTCFDAGVPENFGGGR